MKNVRGPLSEDDLNAHKFAWAHGEAAAGTILDLDDALRAALERAEKAEWALRERLGPAGAKLLWDLRDGRDAALAKLKTADDLLDEIADECDCAELCACSTVMKGLAKAYRNNRRSETTPLRSESGGW